METKKDTRCVVKIPLDLMIEIRNVKVKHHTTIAGALALLINFYKEAKNEK